MQTLIINLINSKKKNSNTKVSNPFLKKQVIKDANLQFLKLMHIEISN